MINLDLLWSEVLTLMEKSLTEVVFTSVILPLVPIKLENDVLVLEADNNIMRMMVNSRYLFEISRCVKMITNQDVEVQVTSHDASNDKRTGMSEENYAKTNLRKRYTFDTFVQGKSTEFAYAAAMAVAETPGMSRYNPLFIYGGVGLGKTHLIQSIGNYIVEQSPELTVLYQSTETFTNEMIYTVRHERSEESKKRFKDKYRSCDVLLLDDIQFLKGKESTQEEIFHTFNILHDNNKQIVLTSDLPPKELTGIEERLTSRFGMGVIVDVILPDYETRTAILENKLARERLTIPDSVKELIVRNITSNIRDLEGALNKVTAYARLTNTAISFDLAEQALRDQLEESAKPEPSVEFIQEVVAEYYNLHISDLKGDSRKKNFVLPRQIAMYLCRKILPNISLLQVGDAFNKDHTTVMYACGKTGEKLENDNQLQNVILDLERKILNEA